MSYRSLGYDWVGHCGTSGSYIFMNSDYLQYVSFFLLCLFWFIQANLSFWFKYQNELLGKSSLDLRGIKQISKMPKPYCISTEQCHCWKLQIYWITALCIFSFVCFVFFKIEKIFNNSHNTGIGPISISQHFIISASLTYTSLFYFSGFCDAHIRSTLLSITPISSQKTPPL